MASFHEVLAPLILNCIVTKVEKGHGREGDPALVTIQGRDFIRTFEVCSGVYGPVVTDVQETCQIDLPPAYIDVQQMLDSMLEHVLSQGEGTPDLFEALGDPMTLRLGFRCRKTGREWWTGIGAIKVSPYRDMFSTPESRQELANRVSSGTLGWSTGESPG